MSGHETPTRSPKDALGEFLRAVQTGDLAAAGRYLAPDVVLREPPDIVVGGVHTGVVAWTATVTLLAKTYAMDVSSFAVFESGDRAFLTLDAVYTARSTGRSARARSIEVYRFAGGLIVDVDIYHHDPRALADLVDS